MILRMCITEEEHPGDYQRYGPLNTEQIRESIITSVANSLQSLQSIGLV